MSNPPGNLPVETQVEETPSTVGGLTTVTTPKKGTLPALGPDQTTDLLAQMQQMIDQRAGVAPNELMFSGGPKYNTIMNSLKDVAAWSSGGVKGPGEGLALRDAEKAKEAKDLFEMRTQMAGLKSAQEQQKQFDKQRQGGAGLAGAPGAMTYNGVQLPEELQAIYTTPGLTRDQWNKEFNTWAQNTMKERSSAGSQTQQPYKDENGAIIGYFTPAEWAQRKAKTVPAMKAELAAPTDAAARVGMRESTNQPDIGFHDLTKGTAYGTYGITKKAYEDIQKENPAFQGRDITTLKPEEQTAAFNTYRKLASDQLTKLNVPTTPQNLDLAHFLGPTGAADYLKTGTVSADAAASNGGAQKANQIAQGILAGKATPVSGAATRTSGLSPIEEHELALKVAQEEQTASGKKRGESNEAMRTAFEVDTDPGTLTDNYATSRRIQTLVKNDPTLSGVLTGPGYAKAVGTVLEKGIGNFGIQALDDAIYQTLPSTTNLSAAERKELSSYLAKIELQSAKLIKGQGQITEGEREILQRSSSSIKDPAELIYKKARVIERATAMNEKLADIYGDGEKYTNFRKFKNEPEFKRIHAEFRGDLENILNEKIDFTRNKANAAPAVKEGTQTKSLSGKDMIYKNGKWEYK